MSFKFRKITAGIPTPTRAAGEAALRYGCAELGIPVESMGIQWVLPSGADFDPAQPEVFFESTTDLAGMTNFNNENTIFINATLNPREAARTVIHELAHIGDARKYAPPRSAEDFKELERRASDFETKKRSFWSRFSTEENEWVALMRPVLLYRRREAEQVIAQKSAIKAQMGELIAELRSEWL